MRRSMRRSPLDPRAHSLTLAAKAFETSSNWGRLNANEKRQTERFFREREAGAFRLKE